MKALVKKKAEKGLWMEEVPIPRVDTNEVLIRIQKTAVCGTDLHIYKWNEWARRTISPPIVIGHEFVGVVEKVGIGVTHYKEGDIVSGEGHITCGYCRNCRAGKRHLCHRTVGVGIHRDGAFAEFLVIPEQNVWPVHPDIPLEVASCFDPYGNAVHTALSFKMVGEDVLITGAGPIGLMAIPICKFVGARFVVITDVNEYRLRLAMELGATKTVNVTTETIEDTMKTLGMTNGFDVGLEMSGHASALNNILQSMYNGGKVALLGLLSRSTQINWDDIIFKGLIVKGIYGREMFESWYKMTQMLRSGLDISNVITHRIPIDSFQEGFDILESGECGKIILEWS